MSALLTNPSAGDERMRRPSILALLPLVLVAAAGTFANLNNYLVAAGAAVLADQFVRLAVTNRDLGWKQLPRLVQRLLPRQTPQRQAQPRKADEAGTGLALFFVEKHSLSEGGEVLVYELRSRLASGWSDQLT